MQAFGSTQFLDSSRQSRLTPLPQGSAENNKQLNAQQVAQARSAETPKNVGGGKAEFLFGTFHLFPAQYLLLENGKPVSLGSRALEILIAFMERPGELIGKQELMARIWPNIFVEPANLSVNISALRRALRDGQGQNRFIINIPGRGYSFVAPVAVAGTESIDISEHSFSPRDQFRYSAVA